MKAQLIANPEVVVELKSTNCSEIYSVFSLVNKKEPMLEQKFSFAAPFVTGRIYSIWWHTGIDFNHLSISTARLFTAEDKGIIFKFNYTENR